MYVICCFFFMIRRPPISTLTNTLFPYPSLFRSEGRQEMRLLVAEVILPCTPLQTVAGDREHPCREVLHGAVAERRLQRMPGHAVAEARQLLRRPALAEIPGRVERRVVVEQPDP